MPWPCWGTAEMGHPGTPNLYDTSKEVAKGGLNFRARFGVERDGVNLLAEDSWSVGAEIEDGYPEFTADMLKQLGWWDDLSAEEQTAAEGKNWKTDLSGGIQRVAIEHGCAPFGNAKARVNVWTFPDPVPVHREPLYAPDRELVAKYPTYEDRKSHYRLPTRYASIQAEDYSKDFPLIHTSGRLVEYEGGGEETRSNPWLAELQQDMFVEINPADANDIGVKHDAMVWLEGPEGGKINIKAMVTDRVARGVVFTPFHFGGVYQGDDLLDKYPEGAAPYVRGESDNTTMTYGYDSVTQMQESKVNGCVTACKNEHEVPWGVNRRRVVTLDDGQMGEKSISVACMHCTDAPCQAVCPVDCFSTTSEGIVLHDKDLCIGCGYCFYACPFGAPQYPQQTSFGARGKMDKCTFCAGGPDEDNSLTDAEYEQYGRNRIAEGSMPLCAEMCATKALIAGDGDEIADIYRERVLRRGGRPQTWGWETAYTEG